MAIPAELVKLQRLTEDVKLLNEKDENYDEMLDTIEDCVEAYYQYTITEQPDIYVPLPFMVLFGTPAMECMWVIGGPSPYQDIDGNYTRRLVETGAITAATDEASVICTSSMIFCEYDDAAAFAAMLSWGSQQGKVKEPVQNKENVVVQDEPVQVD